MLFLSPVLHISEINEKNLDYVLYDDITPLTFTAAKIDSVYHHEKWLQGKLHL